MAPIQVFSLRTSSPPHFNPKSGHKATSSVAHPTVCTQHPRSNQHFWELISLLLQWDHSSKSACPCSCKGIIKVWAILRPSPHSTWMMLFSALAFGTSAASGFLWGSREQNMSPSSHLLSENSWKLRLKTALPLGFTFLCLYRSHRSIMPRAASWHYTSLSSWSQAGVPEIFSWHSIPVEGLTKKCLNQSRNTQN